MIETAIPYLIFVILLTAAVLMPLLVYALFQALRALKQHG